MTPLRDDRRIGGILFLADVMREARLGIRICRLGRPLGCRVRPLPTKFTSACVSQLASRSSLRSQVPRDGATTSCRVSAWQERGRSI